MGSVFSYCLGIFLPTNRPPVHLLIHSPVDRHLSCFPFFGTTERAAVNVFCTSLGESARSFPLGVALGVELLSQKVGVCFAFVDIASFPK